MDLDIAKLRRNVIAAGSAICVYIIGGGTNGPFDPFNGAIVLENTDRLLWLSFALLAYFTWRYWQATRQEHSQLVGKWKFKIYSTYLFNKLYSPLLKQYIDKYDLDFSLAFDQIVDGDDREVLSERRLNAHVERKSRTSMNLVMEVKQQNNRGDFPVERVRINPVMYFATYAEARLRTAVGDIRFSNLFVPYVIAGLAASLGFIKWAFG